MDWQCEDQQSRRICHNANDSTLNTNHFFPEIDTKGGEAERPGSRLSIWHAAHAQCNLDDRFVGGCDLMIREVKRMCRYDTWHVSRQMYAFVIQRGRRIFKYNLALYVRTALKFEIVSGHK